MKRVNIQTKGTLVSVFKPVAPKSKKKKKTKKASTRKVKRDGGIELSPEQVLIVDDAIHLLARLAANPPRGQEEMSSAVAELSKNELALTAFRTYLDV